MADETRNFTKILFPTDFTEASEHAVQIAVSLAGKYGAKLYVIHVLNFSEEAAGFYVPHLSFDKLDKEVKDRAEGLLKEFCLKQIKHFKDYEVKVIVGEAYMEISKFAKDTGVDLIVMGTYGKAGLDKFFFGSTTERVMRKAECPVLIVPPEK